MGFLRKLEARTARAGSSLCLGLDPQPDQFPPGLSHDAAGLEKFGRLLLESTTPYAAAVKANLAFFEAFGSEGLRVLERLRAHLPPDIPFIADAKRGDIGSTAERHVIALIDALGADAVTVNPYLGRDALEPFLTRRGIFVYLLCRTSNPSAAEVQELDVGGMPLYLRIAQLAQSWAGERPNVGLVVGATAPADLARAREVAPSMPFLVPGAGRQRGDVEAVMAYGPATAQPASLRRGGALLVNVSRAIADAARTDDEDPGRALAIAASDWSARFRC
ncbi:MAG TPA: orotidine-5'-phosphate decarboxylase [Candidatus Limnocylindrales bacterium]|jgi:orotidine-5'-phosphate decarboxylase|nr:orotidine-5'-phosphate decarboxylase [Candidatus Limnocylindrales bacterium]